MTFDQGAGEYGPCSLPVLRRLGYCARYTRHLAYELRGIGRTRVFESWFVSLSCYVYYPCVDIDMLQANGFLSLRQQAVSV